MPEDLNTPYGQPSGKISHLNWEGGDFFCFSRHGDQQSLAPAEIPYLANAFALKKLGVQYWISVSLVSSLKGPPEPGCLVVADDYTSFGIQRSDQFFGGKVAPDLVFYTDNYKNTVSTILKEAIAKASKDSNIPVILNLEAEICKIPLKNLIIYAGVQGPNTGTFAEEKALTVAFENVITGMTNMTEALVCKQAGIEYAGLSFVGGQGLNYSGVGDSISYYLQNLDTTIIPILAKLVSEKLPELPTRNVDQFLSMCTGRKDLVKKALSEEHFDKAEKTELTEIIKILLK